MKTTAKITNDHAPTAAAAAASPSNISDFVFNAISCNGI